MKTVTRKQTIAVVAVTALTLGSVAHLASAESAIVASVKKVLYEADFSTLDPAFGETSKIIHAGDGKLVLEPDLNSHYRAINQGMLFDDADVTVDVKIATAGGPTPNFGLVFWAKSVDDYYCFSVIGDGRVGINHLVKTRWITPMTYRANSAVKTGADVVNQLRVVTVGNRATVSVNGIEVATIQGQAPEGGSFIGVAGECTAEQSVYEFSNLKVSK